ncbi:hypothetical protein NMY22_g16527 [Coprinellus aureogranulatus]|nr:hypothetical protein NMY22_g16527 [Coprinellus aureogranulatus]
MSSLSLASNPGSMVDEVPVEIMRQIFEYCIAREGRRPKAEGQAQGTSLFTSVYTLCLVCSSWKDIAMGHPPLWSTVVIRAGLAKSEHSSKDIQVLQVQVFYIGRLLARISSFPWSLYIHLGHSPSLQQPSPLVHADSNYIVQPNFSESGPRFPLWTSLPRTSLATLKLLHIFTPVRWPHLENLELPNLESLVVEVNINLASDFENGDLPSLPRLVKLAVIGMPFFMFPSTVPWSQLTHLHLEVEMMFMEDLEKILLKSAHLREASFKVPDVHGVLPRLSARVPGNGSLEPLTRLKGITFSAFYPDLTNISWPNLNYLRLTESDIQRIPASLQKLSSLTHLEFSCRRIETPLEPFIKVIDACPLLVRPSFWTLAALWTNLFSFNPSSSIHFLPNLACSIWRNWVSPAPFVDSPPGKSSATHQARILTWNSYSTHEREITSIP